MYLAVIVKLEATNGSSVLRWKTLHSCRTWPSAIASSDSLSRITHRANEGCM